MPYNRPTLAAIAARIKTDMQTSLSNTAAWFRRSFERGAQNALAGVAHGLYGHQDWVAKQLDPRAADDDQVEKIHGEPYGIYKKEGVKAQLTLTASGVDATEIPADTLWIRADGKRYVTDADATIASGSASVSVTAEDIGDVYNTDDGAEISLLSPIAGVDSDAIVLETTTVGTDLESPEDYLVRVLETRQSPPRGGAAGDYANWALEVSGVTRAWEYPRREGAGTVTLYLVNDAASPITVDSPKIDEVAEHLDQAGRQPTTVDVYIFTPTLSALNPQINLSPNTADVQAAVTAEITALLNRAANPGAMTLLWSQLNEAISIAAGESDHVLVSPSADVVYAFGSLPVTGTPVFGSL